MLFIVLGILVSGVSLFYLGHLIRDSERKFSIGVLIDYLFDPFGGSILLYLGLLLILLGLFG